MKYSFIFVLAFLLVSSVAFADNFAPTLLKLSAAPELSYAYDGSNLEVDFNVTGHDATVFLVVMTKDKGEEIGFVRNGNLGWHMVNKIDTTIYYSATPVQVGTGGSTITWDGRDMDGNLVDSDTYQYFLYAYDHVSEKIPATTIVGINWTEKGKIWTIN